jgi:preprotein translocase SecE subunit
VNAVETADQGGKVSRLASFWEFLLEAKAELFKITWPSQPELKRATIAIVILSVVLGVSIGLLDKVLTWLLVDGVAQLTR